MPHTENNFEIPEGRPELQEIVPDAAPDRHRNELPIPPDLVDDLMKQIDDGKTDPGIGEDEDGPKAPTFH